MNDDSKDWLSGDPFSESSDPAAIERERRRKEREERRREREAKRAGEEAPAPQVEDSPPVAPPPPRSAEAEFWDDPPAEASATTPPPPRGPRSGSSILSATRRHPLRIVGTIAAIAVVWFLAVLFQPFHGDGSGRVTVAIPKGASVAEVGDLLDRKGVVSSSTLFQLRVTLAGKRSDLYPGQYALASGMSYGAAIDALSTVPVKTTTTVTIPEGYSRDQTAEVANEVGLSGDYLDASVSSKYLDPAKYGGKGAKSLEGFLFPDTFELKAKAPVDDLVQLQLQDFKRRIKDVDMRYAHSKNLTVYDVVTIASMVEREAQIDSERPLIAAVIYNRLHEGIPLGIDATIRFATGNYEQPLTESELAVDSPYNTRLNGGLPPGPIDSPGLASIEAAARPAKVDYLYYVVKPGTCGEHSFSSTDAEFQADVVRYNEAREAAGGESPDSC